MRLAVACLAAASFLVSACTTHGTEEALHMPYTPITALVLADGVSVMATSKTVEDHVAGWVTGQDCSVIRASHGGDYCVAKDKTPRVAVASYCYKTLAKTTCYDQKQPSDASTYAGARVDMVPINAIR